MPLQTDKDKQSEVEIGHDKIKHGGGSSLRDSPVSKISCVDLASSSRTLEDLLRLNIAFREFMRCFPEVIGPVHDLGGIYSKQGC